MRRLALAVICICSFAFGTSANAQTTTSVTANFGSFYGKAPGAHSVNVLPHAAGNFSLSSGGTFQTTVGLVSMPSSFSNPTGQQTTPLTITFSPNGVDGAITGNFTTVYSNSSGGGSLTLQVSLGGDSMVPVATAGLKYKILSILYTPPGNASTNGFSNTQSAGDTTSVSQNFSVTDSITFAAGAGGVNNSVTFTTGQSVGNGSSSTTTYQATSGSQLGSVEQTIDHNQDQVYILVDPSISVTQTAAAAGFYQYGPSLDATGNFGTGGVPSDILNVNIAGLKNPSSIPLEILLPQVVLPGTTLPGLSFICANPLPANQCTQQNACGCTAADFAPIVAEDELNNVATQSTAPNSIDANRYVFVQNVSLQGPDQAGAGPVKNTFALSDATMSQETTSNGSLYGVSYSHNFGAIGPFTLGITNTEGFSYSRTETAGVSNGTAHVGTATLGTSDVGCFENVNVYEDTIYHTFAFALPEPAPANCQ